ncbi:MAG: hypothetical protein IJZ39_08885 [Oscillospiraceae bacterium]|nr:hypothetical protein [Oscillospiraceae bacterium]
MYNRYIPHPDGSYRKNRMPEQTPQEPTCAVPDIPAPPPVTQRQQSAEGFLRALLPKGLDTGDLLIIVLLLLMGGDCDEDRNTALLTLALYLFL